MLRATTACTFSTSQLPKVVLNPQFLTQFTSKCASRHNGVQLFISHLPRCLRTRRFSEPTFQPSGTTKPRKNTVFRDFPTFSRTCIFFLLIFSLLTLLPADCFFISPYCRKFDFQTSFDNYIYICQDMSRWPRYELPIRDSDPSCVQCPSFHLEIPHLVESDMLLVIEETGTGLLGTMTTI